MNCEMHTGSDHALIAASLDNLRAYIEKENFRGYDPYDTLNAYLPFRRFGKLVPILAIQFQKRNPVNIRPLLGIAKAYNPKALGLLLQAYSKLQAAFPERNYSAQINFLFTWLKQNYSQGYSGYCWGYNFDWASSGKYIKAHSPNIVVTAFVAKGLIAYHALHKDAESLQIIKSVGNFILMDLPRSESKNDICFSYTTLGADQCYNASLLAAEVLAHLYRLTGEGSFKDYAVKAGSYVIGKQFTDGHWNYSFDEKTGKERVQIDFHQGYVIDSLKVIARICCPEDERYIRCIERGLAYYRKEQFFENGQSKWRLPTIYPVEIHNQSQGIITFSQEDAYRDFAMIIARWTIENMQDKKGFFYYRKLRAYTNKIPFMRWSQAWMFTALTELLLATKQRT